MKPPQNLFIIGILFIVSFCMGGCVSLPKPPSASNEYFNKLIQEDSYEVLYKDDKHVLVGINTSGSYGLNNIINSWLYIADSDGSNWRLIDVDPKNAPAVKDGEYIGMSFISVDNKVVCRKMSPYNYGYFYYMMDLDGGNKKSITNDEYYVAHMKKMVASDIFIKDFNKALGNKEYRKAESMRVGQIGKISEYLKETEGVAKDFSGNAKYHYEMLEKEKTKLENIVGLTDPALCQLREKFVEAIGNNDFDNANKIYELVEKMEKKYRPENIQQVAQVLSTPQPQSQTIIVKEAPSLGKQMRAGYTMTTGVSGGQMTSQQQNAWLTLIGMGDFVDASQQ